jgi:hypothetical protein
MLKLMKQSCGSLSQSSACRLLDCENDYLPACAALGANSVIQVDQVSLRASLGMKGTSWLTSTDNEGPDRFS